MSGYVGVPDYYERKGSLFLRSDHMNYGRPTLNSNWHQAREAEPKDYNISDQTQKRNLHTATYRRIGDITDGEQPPDFPDHSNGYRKCHSQFTDTADYRRFGRNTWQDESAIYANRDYKRALFPPTHTIPQQLE
ncbi:protein C9orf135-like [Anneissia japonica]|uniref:protein C9orf135-like n=1 Tax=Anneissia japonica TaxID=1529436 RepID=UPI0014259641|nr:protein C9orf135-like [Anneissia japonica]